jgi:hypothetical protein
VPRSQNLECSASSAFSIWIFGLDLDAGVILSTKTRKITLLSASSQTKMDTLERKWQNPLCCSTLSSVLYQRASALLCAVEALLQLGRPEAVLDLKALWLLHVDLDILELAVAIGNRDVDGLQFQIL